MKKVIVAVLCVLLSTPCIASEAQKVSTDKALGCLMTAGLFGGGMLLALAPVAPILFPSLFVGCIMFMPEKKLLAGKKLEI